MSGVNGRALAKSEGVPNAIAHLAQECFLWPCQRRSEATLFLLTIIYHLIKSLWGGNMLLWRRQAVHFHQVRPQRSKQGTRVYPARSFPRSRLRALPDRCYGVPVNQKCSVT